MQHVGREKQEEVKDSALGRRRFIYLCAGIATKVFVYI